MTQSSPVHRRPSGDLLPVDNHRKISAAKPVALGALLGLAWGASLRAWMATLALQLGDSSAFTWQGTFAAILLPATIVGGLIGLAVYSAQTSERGRWRWVLLSPLLLVLAPAIVQKDFLSTLLATGMGGGAIGVALVGILGGYAFSGFGSKGARWLSGILALLFAIVSIAPAYLADRSSSLSLSAGEVFGVTLFLLLMALFVGGISAPSRAWSSRHRPADPLAMAS